MPKPRLSIIIAVHNGGRYLRRTLDAVFETGAADFEVLVVDDASTDDSRRIAANYPCRLIELAERGGPGRARNVGARAAAGEVLFFTDADVLIPADLVGRLLAFFDLNPGVAGVIGAYTERTDAANFTSVYKNMLHHYVHQRSRGAVASFFTACGAVTRAAFFEVGGFDESARDCALEDVELGLRLYKAGHRVLLLPELQVTHLKRYTLASLIYADFWQRAVPYTLHLLRHRVVRSELSTRNTDRLSVALLFLSLGLPLVSLVAATPWLWGGLSLAGFGVHLSLHRSFYGFLWRRRGSAFLMRAVAMQVLTYLYSGVGFGVGLLLHLRRSAGRPAQRNWLNPHLAAVTPPAMAKAPADLLRMAFNENPLGPSPLAVRAMREALSGSNRYPDSRGEALVEALAEKHGVGPENVMLGQGASEVLEMIARAFLCPGDEVIFADPTFPWYPLLGQQCGARNLPIPLRDDCVDLDAMAGRISGRTKAIFIANPNNPTGTLLGQDEIDRFLRRVAGRALVVFDEAYIDFASRPVDTVAHIGREPVIVVRTFSKSMGLAGLRIGYGLASRDLLAMMARVRRPYNTSAVAQAAALASLRDEAHLRRTRDVVAAGRTFLSEGLARLGLRFVPSQANFILFDAGREAAPVLAGLAERGILVRPAPGTCLRVTVGTPEQNVKFLSALREVLAPARTAADRRLEPAPSSHAAA